MRPWLRATAALALLLFRHWARASLPDRLRRNKGRRTSAAVFRFAYFAMMSAWGYTVGHLVTKLEPETRVRGAGFIVVGLVGLAVVWSALTRGPSLRGDPSPLETTFLETLPLRASSRLVVGLLERIFVHWFGAAALVAVAPGAPARAIVTAFALSTTGIFVGEAMMRLARVALSPMMVARLRSYLLVLGQVVFLMCVVQAPALAKSQRLAPLVAGWPSTVARAIAPDGPGLGPVLVVCVVVLGLALAVIELAERIGWDRVELVPSGRVRRAASRALVVDRIDDVLRGREPGGRWSTLVMAGYSLLVTLAILGFAWNARRAGADAAGTMIRGAVGLAGFGAFVVVTARGARMATRDVAARALLAPLPIAPRDLLSGKVVRLRWDGLIVALPVALLFATPWSRAQHVEIAWRVATLLVGVVLAAEAAAAIAFLTVGAGSRKGPGGGFAIESVLVLAPLVGVTTAQDPWGAVVPLVGLGLVAREARRSGLRCVRWLDDADDFERETPIWRALLVLAAFQATEVLAVRLAAASDLDSLASILVRDLGSAAVLLVLTLQARRDAPMARFEAPPAWFAGGLTIGLASGAFAVWLAGSGLAHPPLRLELLAPVLLAPVAEEVFFRGWLQPCVEDEVAHLRRRRFAAIARPLAVLVTAFAAAGVAPAEAFLPRLVLGLGVGALASGSRRIGPGILAHLAHTILVVLFANGVG